MVTPELQNYVEQSFAAGKTKEQIASDLRMAGGWQQSDIDEVFAVLQKPPYAKTTRSKFASFFIDLLVIVLIIGAIVFAAEKIDAPVVNSLFSNIVAALPFKQNAPVTPAPQPLQEVPVVATQTPATDDMPTQSPTVAPLVAPATPPALVACKANDSTCLLQAAATCNPATEQNTTSTTSPKETSSRFYAIIGIQNNQCTFTFSVKSDSVKANTGKGALCNISSTNDLTTVLTDWTSGDFATDDAALANECSGSYFNN